jgi:hypothetical protein
MKKSYNSVGAGETPKLGYCKSIEGEAMDGGAQTLSGVKVTTEIPKAGPGSAQGGSMRAPGEPPKAAAPGGAQGIKARTVKAKPGIAKS